MTKILILIALTTTLTYCCAQSQQICSAQLPPSKKVLKQCCKKTEFQLSPYPSVNLKCTLDTSSEMSASEEIDSEHLSDPCKIDCIFRETGILMNGGINQTNVKIAVAKSIKDPIYRPIFETAFVNCNQYDTRNKTEQCGPMAKDVMKCVFAQVFINCPAERWLTNNNICNNAREYMKNCPDSWQYIIQD